MTGINPYYPSNMEKKARQRPMTSSLAQDLSPRKLKFTSKTGLNRRSQLLDAARELLSTNPPSQVSFADVCERAEIPRPSAYHFFTNIESIFLGLRILHAESVEQAVLAAQTGHFSTWQDYLASLIETGAKAMNADKAMLRMIYDSSVTLTEIHKVGQALDSRLARLTLEGLESRFAISDWENREKVFAIAFTLVDSIFRLSYRMDREITNWMIDEAKRSATSYLRNYLPELLPSLAG